MLCVLSFLVLLAPTSLGRQGSNTLWFLLGWQHIAQQQRQLLQVVDHVLQQAELPTTVYRLESIVPQRRGREHWQRQKHLISIPSVLSLTTFDTLFQAHLPRPPFSVLARRTLQTPSYTAVELTLGIAGVSTDIFVFAHFDTVPIEAARVSNTPQELPLEQQRPPPSPPLPQIAIVIDDLGWDLGAAQVLLAMEVPLSFAILPQTPYKDLIAREAQRRGRDILLHLPMEPYSYPYVNPGRPVLLGNMDRHEFTTQMESALATVPSAVGVNNHMGSRLTEDRAAMHTVMQWMKQRNLFFLDSRTSPKSLAYQVAREFGVRTAQRHVFLDNETDPLKIAQQLQRLAAFAREHGSAIGIGHPYPETVQSLRYTLPEIQQTGIEVVPVSRLVQ
jgi:polysaccharide deacetylase 2 family uncharacterized protein YibQ